MHITSQTFLIICPLLFLAGMIDAIGGGGGLISIPAYLIAGLPPHTAIATNKLSSACGTTLATIRFARNGLIHLKAIPAVIMAMIGSSIGAHLSMRVPEQIMTGLMVAILPISACLVLNKKLFHDQGSRRSDLKSPHLSDRRHICIPNRRLRRILRSRYRNISHHCIHRFCKNGNQDGKRAGKSNQPDHQHYFSSHFPSKRTGSTSRWSCRSGMQHDRRSLGAGLVMKNGARIIKPILLVLLLLALKVAGPF